MKATETGVCDVEGNCLCSGELEDPEEIFENNPDDDNGGETDVGVGIAIEHGPSETKHILIDRCCRTS